MSRIEYFDNKEIVTALYRWRGEFLSSLEQRFGQRDMAYSLGGFGYDPALVDSGNEIPRTFFSHGVEKRIDIKLTRNAYDDAIKHLDKNSFNYVPLWLKWQLAHECVHLLDPAPPTNVLEEGLATWFQNEQVSGAFHRERGAYHEAYVLVKPLMRDDSFSVHLRRLRSRGRRIGSITMDELAGMGVVPETTVKLAAQFGDRATT